MGYDHQAEIREVVSRLDKAEISFKNKTVLVTGGAGFLGSWICEVLLEQGAKVICLDNFSSGRRENIEHLKNHPSFHFIHHDISFPIVFGKVKANVLSYPNLEARIDVIMHLASRASPFEFERYPISIIRSNTLGTMNTLELAREYNAIFFYSSTSEVYGNPPKEKVPTSEEYYGNVNPIGPRSCYDESKRVGEAILKAYEKEYGVNVHFVRIFNTYGARIRAGPDFGRVVPNFIMQCLKDEPITIFGKGTQTRSFTYVVDEVEGMLKDVMTPEARGLPINIGNDIMTSVQELAETIKRLTNSNSKFVYEPLPKDDPLLRQPRLDRAKKILKWEPTTKLEEGLRKTIEWFKEALNKGIIQDY